MKNHLLKIYLISCLSIIYVILSNAQIPNCSSQKIVTPKFSAATFQKYEDNLKAAKTVYDQNPNDPEALIWLGRRTAYLGNYEAAIALFTEGVQKYPTDARFLRHRGHRYLSIRCLDAAIADFEKAAALTLNQPDAIEPDGLPNAQNTPTSTLQTNIYYHLGLVYFLKKDYKSALKAYKTCLKLSKNPDMYVATANWLYITYRQLGQKKAAKRLLSTISADRKLIENEGYLEILLLHKGKKQVADFEKLNADALGDTSMSFGLGMYYALNNRPNDAKRIFEKIVTGTQWSSFGFIAAEKALEK